MTPELKRLCRRLDHQFSNSALLTEALSHRSTGAHNYERLEFLGDSILNFVIATVLFERFPELDEGSLSRLRASLVNGTTLSQISRELELGQYLILGPGELKSGGFNRDSILSDVVESLIGAVYLDAGLTPAEELVLKLFSPRIDALPAVADLKDPKTRLQEKLQARGLERPDYVLIETAGKAHQRQFTVSCRVEQLDLQSAATASSRRKAEQAAAAGLLVQLMPERVSSA